MSYTSTYGKKFLTQNPREEWVEAAEIFFVTLLIIFERLQGDLL